MKYYVLKHVAEGEHRLTCPEFEVGGRSGLLISRDHSALLFTSGQAAESYAKVHNLEGFRAYCPDQRIGDLLAILAGVDRCRNALVDGKDEIVFFSCYSGAYVLPAHFYRHTEEGYEVLKADDQRHCVTVDFRRPMCGCGGLLGIWTPWSVTVSPLDEMFGVHQIIAGNCIHPDEMGCDSIVRIDMVPPRSSWQLELLLHAGDDEEVVSYNLSVQGFMPLLPEIEDVQPWWICPITGLVSIGIPRIQSDHGIDSIELRVLAVGGPGKERRILATTEVHNIPIIHPEQANADAGKQLEQLCL